MTNAESLRNPTLGRRGFRAMAGRVLLVAILAMIPGVQSLLGQVDAVVGDESGRSSWRMLGPSGGNARALAYDPSNPDHILLGTGGGALFESFDRGAHWQLFVTLGPGHELNLENIAFDPSNPQNIYVGGWSITGQGGGFFITRDGGESWSEPVGLRGKSIQALAIADANPKILVAGALDGLYRSRDAGNSWERITPTGHPDLKNFESIAIDPHDPQIIYAGTWHLPWKTTDGGKHWTSIKKGVIDDSDVFSIILSHDDSQVVFASACSGIYRSSNGGSLFAKVRGIPSSARRTRVMYQDPLKANVVYAGTTQGLWKSTDGGIRFQRITPSSFILNDVMVDPRDSNRMLIATDRGGVFVSDDAGKTFQPSNEGFSQRKVTALQAGSGAELFLSVLNDKEFGGVFQFRNGQWQQLNRGLGDAEVLDLKRTSDGALVAATSRGIFRYSFTAQQWLPSGTLSSEDQAPAQSTHVTKASLRRTSARKGGSARRSARGTNQFHGRASALALGDGSWFAATSDGLLISRDQGKSWSKANTEGERDFYAVSVHKGLVAAASRGQLWLSDNDGKNWWSVPFPERLGHIESLTATTPDEVLVGSRAGLLRWGETSSGVGGWTLAGIGLPKGTVFSVQLDGERLLAAVANSIYVSRDRGRSWQPEPPAAFQLAGALRHGEKLYAITQQHGILVLEQGTAVETARYSGEPELCGTSRRSRCQTR
jgi:photosystem II stability/assembly factor-like uncharacterized protein